MNFRFHPQGLEEFERAVLFYEERQSGLGTRFANTIMTAIESIMENVDACPYLEPPVRRKLTRTFPYAILYTGRQNHLLIIAVMHCHQKPGYWKTRLNNEN